MRRLGAWMVIYGLLSPLGVQAQALRFATDAAAPVQLQADKMRWQKKAGLADVSGAAQIVQGPMQLNADTMQLRFDPQGGAQKLLARGRLVVRNQDGPRATADGGEFDLQQDILVLSGNVLVHLPNAQNAPTGPQKLSGARLHIDMKSGKAKLSGGKTRARIEIPAN